MAPFDNFHVYALDWRADRMDFFVDDKKYFTYAKERMPVMMYGRSTNRSISS